MRRNSRSSERASRTNALKHFPGGCNETACIGAHRLAMQWCDQSRCGGAYRRRRHHCLQPLRRYRRSRLRVRAALRAASERLDAVRFDAARCPCRDNAVFDAARRGSRLSAFFVARERVGDGLCGCRPAAVSSAAFRRVDFFADLLAGTFTPARRASDRPIAIACLALRAPCLPCRM